MATRVYVSYFGGLLALWIGSAPSADEHQRRPDGWVSGVEAATDYVVDRLCDISQAPPNRKVVRIPAYAAEWWRKLEDREKRRAAKVRRIESAAAQSLFPIDPTLEEAGKRAGIARIVGRGR